MRDLLEADDPAALVRRQKGEDLGSVEDIAAASLEQGSNESARLLAPCDLQAIKACGVTFARSMIERVIEERAAGDPSRARKFAGASLRS